MVKRVFFLFFIIVVSFANISFTHIHHTCFSDTVIEESNHSCCEVQKEPCKISDTQDCCSELEHNINFELENFNQLSPIQALIVKYFTLNINDFVSLSISKNSFSLIEYKNGFTVFSSKQRVQSIFCNFKYPS